MLINQAKNLATLPFSSLLQLEQSILRTQQLLAQAQRIAYDIQQIDRAFSTTYAPASSSLSDQALIANAQTRWQNAMAGLQDAMRTQATVVGNLDTNRTQMSALVTSSQGATGASAGEPGRQSAPGAAGPATRGSHGGRRGPWARAKPGVRPARGRSGPGQGATAPLPDARPRLSTHNRADVSLMNMKTLERLPTMAAVMLVVLVVAACAIRLRGDEDQTNPRRPLTEPPIRWRQSSRSAAPSPMSRRTLCPSAERRGPRSAANSSGRSSSASSEQGIPQEGSSLFVPPKDESRLSPGYPPIQQPGKE